MSAWQPQRPWLRAPRERCHHHQEQKYAAQDQQAAAQQQAAYEPAPAAPAADDPMAEVQKLAELHSAGVLTDEEFAAAKAKALGI